jgi:hypothetical protein
LVLIAISVVALLWHAIRPGPGGIRLFQATMILFILSGFVGTALHWRGKIEFKLESDPSLSGLKLFREAMKSHTPPALAPAAMIELGLLGLTYAYRHPSSGHKTGA